MRTTSKVTKRGFQAKAYSGIHTILIALNCPEEARAGLLGFSFERKIVGKDAKPKFLRSTKVFPSIIPDPKGALDPTDPTSHQAFYTDEFPVQDFRWGDYAATPGTKYRFRVLPMYGSPGALTTKKEDEITFEIETEHEWIEGQSTHGVWFNRGSIASQKFAEEFGNHAPESPDDPNDSEVKWLSRGLLEACLSFIEETDKKDGIRVAAYEFTYAPIIEALKALVGRGVDVKIVYGDTTTIRAGKVRNGENEKALEAAGFKVDDQKITFKRSKAKIPHNKFILRLKDKKNPVEIFGGSTNFTASGFLGQTNVGHRIADEVVAKRFFQYWKELVKDPDRDALRPRVESLSPDPPEEVAEESMTCLFSPRSSSLMLKWYGRRILDAANSVWFTAAFGISDVLQEPIARKRSQLRQVLLEKPVEDGIRKELTADYGHVLLSYGVPLGEMYEVKDGKIGTKRNRIAEFELDKWFFKEEHYRRINGGFVFFVHTKFLLIDPLSDDPLLMTGSANFSSSSLLENDENMVIIRGDTRVADIYLTEFDRIFQHFRFRNVANELAAKQSGSDAKAAFLAEDDTWSNGFFKSGTIKCSKREMYFGGTEVTWAKAAAEGSSVLTAIESKKVARKTVKETAKKAAKKTAAKKAVKTTPTKAAKKVAKTSAKKAVKAPAKKAAKTAAKKKPKK